MLRQAGSLAQRLLLSGAAQVRMLAEAACFLFRLLDPFTET